MTYLTVIKINGTRPAWWDIEDNIEALHAIVEKSVPDDTGRVLWRVDRDCDKNGDLLIIESNTIPDATGIVEQFGWPRIDYGSQVKTVSIDSFLDSLEDGQRFRFRIAVNPVRKINGKHTPLVGSGALDWITEKLRNRGFEPFFIEQKEEKNNRLFKNGKCVFLKTVTYTGDIKVIDAKLAKETIKQGLGKAKAYGNGLLTLTYTH